MNCIHLDFHTSPAIGGIGERFNKEEFTKVLKAAKVDLVTVFAKCHHGYSYYPTKVGTMHPGLKFNLLKEEIEAIHAAGAKAPIYITIGWSEKDAIEHPEWQQLDFKTGKPFITAARKEDKDAPLPHCSWTTLCTAGGYLDYLEEITREVCESFDVSDGIFYDICFFGKSCGCESCRAGMRSLGMDAESLEDAEKYYVIKRREMMARLNGVIRSYNKDCDIFYNGGANMNVTYPYEYQTHFELEDLPTAWGGYDLMPIRAKFFEKYGKPFLGMTGKFHHAWGEFGGFKNKEALRYECADMLSVGASISVGDHLHPSGKLDESTYAIIGHAFDYVKKIDKYCLGTRAECDLALWMSHSYASDVGASKLLQIMHQEYDVIGTGDELSKYKCIILPDHVKFTETDERALLEFVKHGGQIIASYESVFDDLGIKKIGPSGSDADFIECPTEEVTTPFLSYSSAYVTESEGEVLARVYEPMFNRTLNHFCGHKNTPNKLSAADYPALVRCGGVTYFAHPVFEAYDASGNYFLERYIINAIDAVYDRFIKTEELPSCGRVRLRANDEERFLGLHVLYAPPVNRGNVHLLPDFPRLHDVAVSIKCDKPIKHCVLAASGECVKFDIKDGRVTVYMPPFRLHELVLLEW